MNYSRLSGILNHGDKNVSTEFNQPPGGNDMPRLGGIATMMRLLQLNLQGCDPRKTLSLWETVRALNSYLQNSRQAASSPRTVSSMSFAVCTVETKRRTPGNTY